MVDALAEASRVVSANGCVLDLRPLAVDLPFEVGTSDQIFQLGTVSGAPALTADFACREATKKAMAEGWLVSDGVAYFTFALYWDSLIELRAFLVEHWQSRHRPPPESRVTAAGALLERLGGGARIQVREIVRLARYRPGRRPARKEPA